MSASDVVGQVTDGNNRGAGGGVGIHPQDLAGINLTAASRDLVDVASLTRSSTGRDDLGRARDVIHRPRDIQRALEVLGSLESSTASGTLLCSLLCCPFAALSGAYSSTLTFLKPFWSSICP